MIKVQESSIKLGQHSDTSFSAGSLRAARRAAGAVQHAVDWYAFSVQPVLSRNVMNHLYSPYSALIVFLWGDKGMPFVLFALPAIMQALMVFWTEGNHAGFVFSTVSRLAPCMPYPTSDCCASAVPL